MFAHLPIGRRIVASTLVCVCVAVLIATLANGLSTSYPVRLAQVLACAAAAIAVIGAVVSVITGRLANYSDPADDEEFELLVRRTEQLARENLAAEPEETDFLELDPYNPHDFEELVRDALDDLPDVLRAALDRNVAVIISDDGRRHRAYGLYMGDTVARDNTSDRIVIFRDTLLRDFGHDPDELRAQVLRTGRH